MGTKGSISIVGDTTSMGRKRGDILTIKEKGSIGGDRKKKGEIETKRGETELKREEIGLMIGEIDLKIEE